MIGSISSRWLSNFLTVFFKERGVFKILFVLLSLSPVILAELHFLNALVPSETILVLVAATILAASVSHTFLSFIPAAFIEKGETAKSVISGSAFGSLVSFLPGITSAHATVMAMLARRNRQPEQVITTLSGVINTANVFFCLATLSLIFRARSGATMAIISLLQVQPWEMVIPPSALIYLLIAVSIGATFSFFITKYMGKQFSRLFVKTPYRKMLISIAVSLSVLVFLFTGVLGLLVLLVAACIGLIPVYFGVRRSNCMGVILLPIIVMLWHTF